MYLSLIVPAYNEGARIYDNLKAISEVIGKFTDDYEIIPVNDGSKDNTSDELMRLSSENSHVKPVSYEINKGKGGAIIEGITAANGRVIGFIDADLDIAPDHIEKYLAAMESNDADVVIASKMHKDSELDYPSSRKFFSTGYYILLKLLFGLKVKDTQTGLKLYDGKLIKDIAPKLCVRGYAFDIEILALASGNNAKIIEMPVKIDFQRKTAFGRIRFSDIWKMFTDTISIWWNIKIGKRYK